MVYILHLYGLEVVLYIFLLHVYWLLLLLLSAGTSCEEVLTLELISPIACGPFVVHGKVCLNAEGRKMLHVHQAFSFLFISCSFQSRSRGERWNKKVRSQNYGLTTFHGLPGKHPKNTAQVHICNHYCSLNQSSCILYSFARASWFMLDLWHGLTEKSWWQRQLAFPTFYIHGCPTCVFTAWITTHRAIADSHPGDDWIWKTSFSKTKTNLKIDLVRYSINSRRFYITVCCTTAPASRGPFDLTVADSRINNFFHCENRRHLGHVLVSLWSPSFRVQHCQTLHAILLYLVVEELNSSKSNQLQTGDLMTSRLTLH